MSSIKETIAAGKYLELSEPGDFFRLLVTTGPVDIEFYYQGREIADVVGVEAGYAEYFRGGTVGEFDRVRVYSATTQQVQFVTRYGSDVRYDRGASSVSGSVDLNAATIIQLNRPQASTDSFAAITASAANAAQLIFTAASNVNGAIVLTAFASDENTVGNTTLAFVAKATAPATVIDGEVIASSIESAALAGGRAMAINLQTPQYIAPGKGLYYITNVAGSAGHMRSCRYKLL